MPFPPAAAGGLDPARHGAWTGGIENDDMTQYTIKMVNYPDPPAEELYVRKRVHAHALARQWSEAAIGSGLAEMLFTRDRTSCQDLIRKARGRALISPDGSDTIRWLAETCTKRITVLTDQDAPATRRTAMMLNDNALDLFALTAAIDAVLDLEEALQARHRIATRS